MMWKTVGYGWLLWTLASFLLVGVSQAIAEEAPAEWSGEIQLSASSATGNTENTVLGARFSAKRVFGRYTHDAVAGVDFARSVKTNRDGEEIEETTQDKWFAGYRIDTELSDRSFAYGLARYEEDAFSGFRRRIFLGTGFGWDIFMRDNFEWKVLAGPGIRYIEFDPENQDADEEEDSSTDFAGYLGSELEWRIRDNVTFSHAADATSEDSNTTLSTVFELKTQITNAISSSIKYQIDFETDPPQGREDTDTLLRASMGIAF